MSCAFCKPITYPVTQFSLVFSSEKYTCGHCAKSFEVCARHRIYWTHVHESPHFDGILMPVCAACQGYNPATQKHGGKCAYPDCGKSLGEPVPDTDFAKTQTDVIKGHRVQKRKPGELLKEEEDYKPTAFDQPGGYGVGAPMAVKLKGKRTLHKPADVDKSEESSVDSVFTAAKAPRFSINSRR